MFNDASADCQPNAIARVPSHPVKPLEHLKNSIGVLRLKPDPVICHTDQPGPFRYLSADQNFRLRVRLAELNRVRHQVLHHLRKLGLVRLQFGKALVTNRRRTLLHCHLQIPQSRLHHSLERHRLCL